MNNLKYECCPWFGNGEEINDYGHCWDKNGECCNQRCNGLDKDGNVCEWVKNNEQLNIKQKQNDYTG